MIVQTSTDDHEPAQREDSPDLNKYSAIKLKIILRGLLAFKINEMVTIIDRKLPAMDP